MDPLYSLQLSGFHLSHALCSVLTLHSSSCMSTAAVWMVEWISVARQWHHSHDNTRPLRWPWPLETRSGARGTASTAGEPSPRSHRRTTTEISTQSGLALVYGCNFNPNFSRNGQTLFKIWEFMHVVVHQTLFSCRIIRKWGTFLKSVKMLIHLQSLNMVHGQYKKSSNIDIKHKAKS